MKYLIFHESNGPYYAETITERDISHSNNRVITIINLDDETVHSGGDNWSLIDTWSEDSAN